MTEAKATTVLTHGANAASPPERLKLHLSRPRPRPGTDLPSDSAAHVSQGQAGAAQRFGKSKGNGFCLQTGFPRIHQTQNMS